MVETFYRAFISYSHQDAAVAEQLQRKLETYRVPRQLVDKMTSEGSVPRRLTPLFRDRADFPTSGNLSSSVEAALTKSRFLIVLCSRAAAQSRWVNKEIERFKQLHGDRRVLAAIVENHDAQTEAAPATSDECFPPALRVRYDDKGMPTGERAEPLAADLRETGDGPKYGFLKIVAGLIGVSLDDLVQRDQHRHQVHMQIIAGSALAATAVMGGLTFLAIDAGNEARMQQRQAEGLVEFMLTDLKEKMEAVGRLDALESVGGQALDYYSAQDPDTLDADSLSRRARAQLLIGEINRRRNDLEAASAAHDAAAATTAELLRREPGNPQRIFDHAQSVFYVASVADQRRDLQTATAMLEEYHRLAQRLVEIDEDNPDWRLEMAYATSNLGAMRFRVGEYDAAAELFAESVEAHHSIYENSGKDYENATAYAYALSWLAFAEMKRGNFERVIATIESQLAVYDPLLKTHPDDFRMFDPIATAYRRLGQSKLALGDVDGANQFLQLGEQAIDRLLAREPNNADWRGLAAKTYAFRSQLAAIRGDQNTAVNAAKKAIEHAQGEKALDSDTPSALQNLARALTVRVAALDGDPALDEAAQQLSSLLESLLDSDGAESREIVGAGAVALAEYEMSKGNDDEARLIAMQAKERLQSQAQKLSVEGRFQLYKLCLIVSLRDECLGTAEKLDMIGFAHPDYTTLRSR